MIQSSFRVGRGRPLPTLTQTVTRLPSPTESPRASPLFSRHDQSGTLLYSPVRNMQSNGSISPRRSSPTPRFVAFAAARGGWGGGRDGRRCCVEACAGRRRAGRRRRGRVRARAPLRPDALAPPFLNPIHTYTHTHTHTHTHTTSSNGAHFVVRADLRGRRSHGHTRRGCRLRGQDSRPVPRRHPAPDSVGAKWVHHGTERASGCPSDLEGGNESIRACRACARAPTISHALSHTLGLHPPPPSTPP